MANACPSFRWVCSYLGGVSYSVTDQTGTYEVHVQQSVCEYHLKICNGDDARRELLDSVGILRRAHSAPGDHVRFKSDRATPFYAVPTATVAAFNAWRAAEHAKAIAEIRANYTRYGSNLPDNVTAAPPVVDGGFYVCGAGWTRVPVDASAVAA